MKVMVDDGSYYFYLLFSSATMITQPTPNTRLQHHVHGVVIVRHTQRQQIAPCLSISLWRTDIDHVRIIMQSTYK